MRHLGFVAASRARSRRNGDGRPCPHSIELRDIPHFKSDNFAE
jgi:hypothetical protein